MQTRNIENVEDLSQEGRQQLKEQVERVQKEARRLRAQARRLRRAQNAETRQRKKLLVQLAESGKDWGQNMLQRGSNLATSGASLAGDQWQSGHQRAQEYGSNLRQGVNQLSNQTTQNLADWGDETAYRLRRQGRHLAHGTSDWGDEAAYRLQRQSRNLFQTMADWYEEQLYRLRRQSRWLSRTLLDRKEDTARQLVLQKRHLGRNFADRRDDTTRQIRRQGRKLGRNFTDRRDDAARQMRKQRGYLGEHGGQLLQPAQPERKSTVWSVLGFLAGLLLAGGITYWLIRRGIESSLVREEEGINLDEREPLNEVGYHPDRGGRMNNLGGAIVATRLATSASPTTRFVGVLSSKRYYPIGLHPDVRDLVYFDREEDARAEGFISAQ